jgi:Carboxypeptidase regulatory-like domain
MRTRFAGRKLAISVFVCVSALLLCVLPAKGQAVTGSISGTVADPSGAVIAGANVEVRNVGTGATQTAVTGDQGRFSVPDLSVSTYDVTASKAGFQTVVHKGVTITVGSQLVVNFSLPVGQAQTTITVESTTSQVQTESTALSSLVNQTQMRNLPLNGRNFEQLLSLAPGVTPAGGAEVGATTSLYGNGINFSVAGSRTEGEEFLLDYTNVSDFWNHQAGSGALGTSLGIEAIQEFSVLTNTYSAQFGGNGAVVNAVSKSGTNDFHGSAYEFLRNSALDARNYFDFDALGQPVKPEFRRNQFGGSVGGPIKKDKLFFFVNYEGLRQALGQSVVTFVPEPYVAMGELPCSVQSPANASCPASPSGAPGNTDGTNPILPIPDAIGSAQGANQSAAATKILGVLGLYPAPPVGSPDLGGYARGASVGSQIASENYVLGRMDWTINSKDSLFGRYVSDRANSFLPFPYFGSNIPGWPEEDQTKNQYFTLEEKHLFSSNVVNEARLMFVRTYENSFTSGSNPVLDLFPGSGRENGFMTPGSVTGIGASQFIPDTLAQNKIGGGDDVVWTRGAHTITFGAEIMRVDSNVFAPFEIGGSYSFTSLQTFLEGSPSIAFAVQDSPLTDNATRYFREIDITPYFNDSWKISSRFTLNLGVRYEYGTNPSGWPLYTILNPPYGNGTLTPNGAFAHVSHVFQTSPNRRNIDPRVGLAWSPLGDQKTAVRAGFGIFHDPVAPRTYASAYYFDPPSVTSVLLPFTGPVPFPDPFLGAPPPPVPTEPPFACSVLSVNAACTSLNDGVPYTTNQAPYEMQWNLNVQRDLGRSTILTVGYVGSKGNHLFVQRNLNPSIPNTAPDGSGTACTPTPANLSSCYLGSFVSLGGGGTVSPLLPRINNLYGYMNENVTEGSSSYNSLQASVVRQAGRGITLQASYTYSHCIDDGSGSYGLEEGALGQLDPYDPRYDRGDCNYDLRHNFVTNVLYALPFRGNRAIEGWQLSGIFTAQSGSPFSVSDGFDQAGIDNNFQSTRPDVVPGCNPYAGARTVTNWFNANCFQLQPAGTLGNAGRNTLVGPRFTNFDFAILKDTKITERLQAQFRAEFFNILNHPNFEAPLGFLYTGACTPGPSSSGCTALPASGPGGALPSAIASTILSTIPALNSQREIQFAIKLLF